MLTQLPGFSNPIHDAQHTFRALLDALSHPGKPYTISISLTSPDQLTLACSAACLTLFDLETSVWLSSEFLPDVKTWLQFHSGCQFTDDSHNANFAVISNIYSELSFDQFNLGTPEYPEQSTTLLIQLQTLTGGQSIQLKGPGIQQQQIVNLPVPDQFWQEWQQNTQRYPLGIDIFFISQNQIMGLPRTTQIYSNKIH